MLKPLSRAVAIRAYDAARDAKLDFTAEPLEAGMGRCPWRITLCSIADYKASVAEARERLARVLIDWPTPVALSKAAPCDVADILTGLRLNYNRADMMVRFSRAWAKDDWDNMLDLIGFTRTALIAVDKYVPLVWE